MSEALLVTVVSNLRARLTGKYYVTREYIHMTVDHARTVENDCESKTAKINKQNSEYLMNVSRHDSISGLISAF